MTSGAGLVASSLLPRFGPRAYGFQTRGQAIQVFDVLRYGAAGDGKTLDTAAIQQAIEWAAGSGRRSQVLLRGRRRFLVGTLELKGGIDFHLADDAQIVVSTKPEDYPGAPAGPVSGDTMAGAEGGVIVANGTQGLTISGTGTFHGRAREFMSRYDDAGGIWVPGPFRPKMFLLTACRDLTVRDITIAEAPNWGLHMLGCEGVLVDRVNVRNLLDVPNCDGIDPDHCRDVEISNCNLVCGDDGIVVKCSRQTRDYGPCSRIRVYDCTIQTQDAGLKIGTETAADVYDVRFERCTIRNSSRGLCIQLRDEGNVHTVAFRDIRFNAHYFADPWWGRGEAISFTALPRTAQTTPGKLHHVTVTNVAGTAENSVRIAGTAENRVHDLTFDRVAVTLDRTTTFPGALFDNRPTTAQQAIQTHDTPGFAIEHAENITLRHCRVTWGASAPESFTYAVEARDAPGLKLIGLQATAARPSVGKAVSIC